MDSECANVLIRADDTDGVARPWTPKLTLKPAGLARGVGVRLRLRARSELGKRAGGVHGGVWSPFRAVQFVPRWLTDC
jgi:hypothetical protein